MNIFTRISLWFHRLGTSSDQVVSIDCHADDRTRIRDIDNWLQSGGYGSVDPYGNTAFKDFVCTRPGCGRIDYALNRALARRRKVEQSIAEQTRATQTALEIQRRALQIQSGQENARADGENDEELRGALAIAEDRRGEVSVSVKNN